jgi:hypothetical protein
MATAKGDTTIPNRTDPNDLSFHEQWAAFQIRQNIGSIQNDIPALVSEHTLFVRLMIVLTVASPKPTTTA